MKAVGPYVLVNIEKKYNDKLIVGGQDLYFDPMYRPTWNITICGEVVALPNVEPFSFDNRRIDPILNIGDKVYFRYVNVDSDVATVCSDYDNEEKGYIKRMEYDDIFCVVRDGVIIPIGGWILGAPELVGEGEEELIDDGRGNKKRTKVKYLSKVLNLVEAYSDVLDKDRAVIKYKSSYIGEDGGVSVGDKVFGRNINFLNTIEGQDFYCFKEDYIMAVI